MGNILDISFRNELENILLDCGYKKGEAHKIVMCRYKKEVKDEALTILETVISLLKEDRYKEILNMIAFSPSGDGYGCDNYYIDFSKLGKDIEDIGDVIQVLNND